MMFAVDTGALSHLLTKSTALARYIDQSLADASDRVISSVAVTECLVAPIRDNNAEELDGFEQFFNLPSVVVADVDRQVATRAAGIRAQFKLKLADSIHLATALTTGAEAFVTTDQDFTRCIGHVSIDIRIVLP